ncbi:WbpN [Salipiger bermudensis HTCC2601]|uniref:WbpN n=1 Tax=Salipiger bermudensis (strain DSM 26914 / JCM 13377 / KCTC 12554 / HTCC2601) TaxID=314265 RepID=Q0FVX6_SALBH|nr:WbpN [Salipiger bermudensis HTCC2601]
MFARQRRLLSVGQRQQREHPRLPPEIGELVAAEALLLGPHQRSTHLRHARTHLVQLAEPERLQLRVLQDRAHHRWPVIRGMGGTRADDGRHRPVHPCPVAAAGLHEERPGAVAVDAEGLRQRDAEDALVEALGDAAGHGAIGLEAAGKAEIGQIEPRHEATRLERVEQRLDLFGRHVGTGRVVAHALHQENIPGPGRLKAVEHLLEGDLAPERIVVGHVGEARPGGAEDRNVVAVGRALHPDRGPGRHLCQQIRHHPQRHRTACGLRRDPALVKPRPHQRVAQHGAVLGIACQREIGLAGLRLDQPPLRLLDRLHHRGLAGGVLIDPHRQVELVAARILRKVLGPDHDGVDGVVPDRLEHLSLSSRRPLRAALFPAGAASPARRHRI